MTSPRLETYTNGYTAEELDYMGRRTLASHGYFIDPFLKPGLRILDLGCGPGSMTLELARRVGPQGSVVGLDRHGEQFEKAREAAAGEHLPVTFVAMDAHRLDFADESFDGIFSHALFEHIAEPLGILADAWRVLKPGGFIGLRSPDWGGLILEPCGEALQLALATRNKIQTRNGGNIHAGRFLAGWLRKAGFTGVEVSGGYEIYKDNRLIANHLAFQLEQAGQPAHAATWKKWAENPDAMFAQAWFAATARK